MKKIIFLIFLFVGLFGNSLEDRVSKLEAEVKILNEKLNSLTNSQKTITKTIEKNSIKSCKNLVLKNFDFTYKDGYIKSYNLYYTLKNSFKKPIKFIQAYVTIKDTTNDVLLEDYIKRDIAIDSNKTIKVKTYYTIDTDVGLAIYLKDTPRKNLIIDFKPSLILFKDGTNLRCKR
jgi:hypothetical protein